MKKTTLFVTLFIVMVLMSACSAPADTAEVEEVTVAALTVGGKAYSTADLEAFDVMTADYTDKEGVTTTYEGVSLAALLEDAGLTGNAEITFVASDGYEATVTVEEALACANCIVAFDGETLRTVMPDMSGKLNVKDIIEIK